MNDGHLPVAPDADFPEDLAVLGRRGALAEPERRRLEMCLTASDSLRVLHQLGCDFDAMNESAAADVEITERLASLVEARYAQHARPSGLRSRIRRVAVVSAAALSLMAVGAVAARGQWPQFMHFKRQTAGQPVGGAIEVPRTGARETSGSFTASSVCPPSVSAQSSEHSQSSAQPPLKSNDFAAADRPAPLPAPLAMTSSELFSAANTARRVGDRSKAVQLYRRLQSEYPNSAEAALSFVMLARLELTRGAARQAIDQFDAYLNRAPGGSLTQEALQGKAHALRQLGKTNDEAATWRELLRRFPDSVYAPTARERLGERK